MHSRTSQLSLWCKRLSAQTSFISNRTYTAIKTSPLVSKYANNVQEYKDNGYTIIKDVLDSDEIKCVQEHVTWLIKKYPDTHPELLEHWFMRNDPFWLSLVSHNKLVDIVEEFLNESDLAIFASHYVCKLGFDGKAIHWHQDGSYWPLEPMKVISLWLAVDDSTISNGCMQVIPKSHLNDLSITNLSAMDFENNVMESQDKIQLNDEEKKNITNLELNAGSISIHHPMLIHGSLGNNSGKRRAGLTLRYIPTTTKVIEDPNDTDGLKSGSQYLVRGQKKCENNYRNIPQFDVNEHFLPSVQCEFVKKYCKY